MLSTKKPKRGLSDSEESGCDGTLTKRQKSFCEVLIASSSVTIAHEIKSHAKEAGLVDTEAKSQLQEFSCTIFSPSFSLHQHETTTTEISDVGSEGKEYVDGAQTILEEIAGTQQAQSVDTWYEIANGEDIEESEELTEFNPYLFIKNLPAHQPALRTLLPPRLSTDPKLCLVLDLDETLVHCSTEELLPADLVFPVVFNNVEYTVFARKRPYIEQFLSQMASLFEIVVFTASQEVYADRLLNILDPDKQYIRHRLFRDSCICIDGNYLKDLTILGRDLSKVVIVDNSPQAFGYQIDNGIPIESWFDDEADEELMRLVPFLESIANEPDVRPFIREKYKLHELVSKS